MTKYNPFKPSRPTSWAARNVIDAAINRSVNRILALSTTRRQSHQSHGATKLCAEKMFVQANAYATPGRPVLLRTLWQRYSSQRRCHPCFSNGKTRQIRLRIPRVTRSGSPRSGVGVCRQLHREDARQRDLVPRYPACV
jgi:hypothetical protein